MSRFFNRAYISRMIIVGIDSIVTVVAYLLALMLRTNFQPSEFFLDDLAFQVFSLLFFRLIAFKVFKTYSGIIQYTGEQDAKRVFYAVTTSSIGTVIFNFFYDLQQDTILFGYSILIIEYFISLFAMISHRLFTKSFFSGILAKEREKKLSHVIVFGAGRSGFITKRTLDETGKNHFKVTAFMDDNPSLHRKLLDGIMIYKSTEENLKQIIERYGVKHAIISVQNISNTRRKEIVDLFLDYKLKIMQVPPAEKWLHGELTLKQIKEIHIEDLLNRDQIRLNTENISREIVGKRVLVTGAAGSIGSELVRQLVKFAPSQIYLLDVAESPLVETDLEIREILNFSKATAVIGDVTDKQRMEQVFKRYRPEIIFHAAAYKHVPVMEEIPSMAIKVNVLGTKTVADLAVAYRAEKFVMISTDKAVNPTNVMGASKRIAEIYIQSLNSSEANVVTRFITTRFGNVLGSNGSVIPRFKAQIEKGGPITVTHPEITRYFMTIPEACQLVLEAGSMGSGGEIFIFDMGESVKILDLAMNMIRLAGFVPNEDIPIKFTGLRPGEKIREELLATQENQRATHHKKIMIASTREYDFEEVCQGIQTIVSRIYIENAFDLVREMKKLVPEFKSNNSQFARLDQELANLNQKVAKEDKSLSES